jgi:hypothetical protein
MQQLPDLKTPSVLMPEAALYCATKAALCCSRSASDDTRQPESVCPSSNSPKLTPWSGDAAEAHQSAHSDRASLANMQLYS